MPAAPPARRGSWRPRWRAYGLRQEDFLTILDGMDMDVAEDIVAPDLATLDLYCERVASAVGRLSIKVFGMEEGPGFELAHHLGRALQLTNILRDIDEDAGIGRLYLPREYLFADDGFTVAGPGNGGRQSRDRCGVPQGRRRWRISITTRPRAFWRPSPRGASTRPRLMGAVYSEISRASEAARLRAAAPSRLAAQGQVAVAGAAPGLFLK